ncbi:MAG: hypothetical protein KJ607_01500, partial [Bacteroidetes bacterium]|nr:hypothetical protein [Bacteroidota bacterium]
MKTLCLTAAMLIVSAAIGLESAAQCTTYAGTLNLAPLSGCEGSSVTAVHNGDYVLDTNDVFAYIVHDGSGTYPYTAIVSGSDATFSDADIPGIVYGQTYYIAAVAGNDDGSGFPDPLDYCYSQSAGVEVVWNQMPNPDAGEDFFVCGKTTCLNAVQSPGTTGLWITLPGVSYDDNTDPQTCVTVNLLDTLDFMWCESNSFCSWCDTVSVAFFQDIEAEQQVYFPGDWPDDIIPNCGLVFTELDANDYISYPTATGYWIDT